MGVRWLLLTAVLPVVIALAGCRPNGEAEAGAPQVAERTSAFRDIGKRAASELKLD